MGGTGIAAKGISGVFLFALALLLAACGGGGGGGGATSGPPFIAAELDSFPTGSVSTGFNSGATVAVLDDSSGASIATATVTMNAVTLTYDVTNQLYVGNVVVAPGDAVTLSVTVGGSTYIASATQFTSYPTLSAPASGAIWDSSIANTVTWSGGAPTTNAFYVLGVLDAADPNSPLIWPFDHFAQYVQIGTTSYSVPAFGVTAGNRLVIVGIATPGVVIPNAAPGSNLVIGGFNSVPIAVPGMPVTSRTSGTTNTLNGVAWSGTQFVAVGSGGTILTSPDGTTWTSRTLDTSTFLGAFLQGTFLQGVTWSGTQFVAVGSGGTVLTSPDGITWTSHFSQGATNILYGVAWSGTQFVAVGSVGTIRTSPDGITWTSQTSGTGYDLKGVTWSGTQFVVVGSFASSGIILTSSDGASWGQQQVNPQSGPPFDGLSGVTWSGAQFVAVGVHIFTSPGGLDPGVLWTLQTSGATNSLNSVAWSGTQFVAVGDGGTIVTSSDGITWTRQASGTANAMLGVAWSGTKFVAVGSGTILSSP